MKYLNQHDVLFRLVVFFISGLPIVRLIYEYYSDALGINPFAHLIETTGYWAMVLLLITLSITPLRRWLTWFSVLAKAGYGKRLSDWNFLIKSRRMIGLWCFFYSCAHLFIYMHFELDWWFEDLWLDVQERRFILMGYVSWFLLVLLAVTSPDFIRKGMGKRWRQLHRLMYAISIVAVLHVYFEAKPNELTPYWYGGIMLVLLAHRVLVRSYRGLRRRDDTGMPSYR